MVCQDAHTITRYNKNFTTMTTSGQLPKQRQTTMYDKQRLNRSFHRQIPAKKSGRASSSGARHWPWCVWIYCSYSLMSADVPSTVRCSTVPAVILGVGWMFCFEICSSIAPALQLALPALPLSCDCGSLSAGEAFSLPCLCFAAAAAVEEKIAAAVRRGVCLAFAWAWSQWWGSQVTQVEAAEKCELQIFQQFLR